LVYPMAATVPYGLFTGFGKLLSSGANTVKNVGKTAANTVKNATKKGKKFLQENEKTINTVKNVVDTASDVAQVVDLLKPKLGGITSDQTKSNATTNKNDQTTLKNDGVGYGTKNVTKNVKNVSKTKIINNYNYSATRPKNREDKPWKNQINDGGVGYYRGGDNGNGGLSKYVENAKIYSEYI